MSRLRRRIMGTGTAQQRAMGAYHPYGTADTPMVMPITRVIMTADGAAVERLTPLITANGAPVPASAPGRWDQIAVAGRP